MARRKVRTDSYIVLLTAKDEDGGLKWDVFFWIGSESSQDEDGVAAYKANELDHLLECFPKGVTYLEGGVDSGFRKVEGAKTDHFNRLYRVYKKPRNVPCSMMEMLFCWMPGTKSTPGLVAQCLHLNATRVHRWLTTFSKIEIDIVS